MPIARCLLLALVAALSLSALPAVAADVERANVRLAVGGKTKKMWPHKHDNILIYAKGPTNYTFNYDAVERIPYMAPDLVGPENAARGKFPTDTWFMTIVPTNSRERTGYPTQKPLSVLRRIVAASSNLGDVVLDFYAGSGTTGVACLELGRPFILVDNNEEACKVMADRFQGVRQVLRPKAAARSSRPAASWH